jgi:hypothetical protein
MRSLLCSRMSQNPCEVFDARMEQSLLQDWASVSPTLRGGRSRPVIEVEGATCTRAKVCEPKLERPRVVINRLGSLIQIVSHPAEDSTPRFCRLVCLRVTGPKRPSAERLLWVSVAPVNPGTPDGNIGGKRKLARKHACVKHLDRFLVLCSIADGPLGG